MIPRKDCKGHSVYFIYVILVQYFLELENLLEALIQSVDSSSISFSDKIAIDHKARHPIKSMTLCQNHKTLQQEKLVTDSHGFINGA
jgi:hypothetical protein